MDCKIQWNISKNKDSLENSGLGDQLEIRQSSTDFWALMSFDGPKGSTKRHEIEGPSKDMRFLGPSKDMRF